MSFKHGMGVEDITLEHIKEAHQNMKEKSSSIFLKTPLVYGMEDRLCDQIPNVSSLTLKLENMQNTGLSERNLSILILFRKIKQTKTKN